VHFTGSTEVGRLVAAEAAATLTSLTLELGGNDAAILLDDALDVPGALGSLAGAALMVTGQACIALKRLYVPRALLGDVVDGLRSVLDAHRIGDGRLDGVTLGPLHTARQRDRVRMLVEEARAQGGEVIECGELVGDVQHGHFLRPSLVSGLANGAGLVQQEQFGPALPIIAYDDVEQALAMANDCDYGLGGSVWSADHERAAGLAARMQAGMVAVNAHGAAAVDSRVPFGGTKASGIGRGGSNRAGLETFTETRAVICRVG
jgi:acyl-CoA reductase-like NAD-dependent aldehyde dehydrogenase